MTASVERLVGGWDFRLLNRAVDGREMVQVRDFVVWGIEGPEGPTFIIVPSGFHSDFASVPRIVRGRYPALGPWARAAILHDWPYKTRGTQDPRLCMCENDKGELVPMFTADQIAAYDRVVADYGGPWPAITRKVADEAFMGAMVAISETRRDGEPTRWTRGKLHRAVRAFGAGGWSH